MKIAELRELGSEELAQKLRSFKQQLLELRMQAASGKLDKPHQMKLLRRDVALVLTLLSQRQTEQAKQPMVQKG